MSQKVSQFSESSIEFILLTQTKGKKALNFVRGTKVEGSSSKYSLCFHHLLELILTNTQMKQISTIKLINHILLHTIQPTTIKLYM